MASIERDTPMNIGGAFSAMSSKEMQATPAASVWLFYFSKYRLPPALLGRLSGVI
jgi:hypothetical protein